jgi:hypothetical protein
VDVVVNQTSDKQIVFSQANKTHLRFLAIINTSCHGGKLSCSRLGHARWHSVAQGLIDLAACPKPMQ